MPGRALSRRGLSAAPAKSPSAMRLDEAGDVDLDRAAVDALGVLAVEAALGFEHGELLGQAEVDFGEVVGALVGGLLGHLLAGDLHAFGGFMGSCPCLWSVVSVSVRGWSLVASVHILG